jgi:AcrR family transcriptional regulator
MKFSAVPRPPRELRRCTALALISSLNWSISVEVGSTALLADTGLAKGISTGPCGRDRIHGMVRGMVGGAESRKQAEVRYGGRGDPVRGMALLWRDGSAPVKSRGPNPGLTVERIVAMAMELADTEGFAALSMRRMAERLGVGTMSLYTYVPTKADLIEVMYDTACGEVDQAWADSWRERLALIARAYLDVYRRHPWMLALMANSRPPLGPNSIANYDHDLRAVDGLGLSDLEMDSVVAMLYVYVQGAARTSVEADAAERDTGMSDEEWWNIYGPLLEKVFDPEKYPTAARVGSVAGQTYKSAYDPEHGFYFGLARLLDGIEVLIRDRTAAAGDG